MSARLRKRIPMGDGEACPKCGRTMSRYRHPVGWLPKPGQPYFFKWWDLCIPCRHVQHYETAKEAVK